MELDRSSLMLTPLALKRLKHRSKHVQRSFSSHDIEDVRLNSTPQAYLGRPLLKRSITYDGFNSESLRHRKKPKISKLHENLPLMLEFDHVPKEMNKTATNPTSIRRFSQRLFCCVLVVSVLTFILFAFVIPLLLHPCTDLKGMSESETCLKQPDTPLFSPIELIVIYRKIFKNTFPYELLIPSTFLTTFAQNEILDIINMKAELLKNVYSQNSAILAIVDAIEVYSRTKGSQKPLIFLLDGPSGTGKTLTASIIAQHYPLQAVYRLSAPFHLQDLYDNELFAFFSDFLPKICFHRRHCLLIIEDVNRQHEQIFSVMMRIMECWSKLVSSNERKMVIMLIVTTGLHSHLNYVSQSNNLKLQQFSKHPSVHHISFMALEKQTVLHCINKALMSQGIKPTDPLVEKIAAQLQYISLNRTMISASGCKLVPAKINIIVN